jgi:hypothetical protein
MKTRIAVLGPDILRGALKRGLEAGNSPDMFFKHYREMVIEKETDAWFGLSPGSLVALKKKQAAERAANLVELPKVVAA